MMCDNASFSSLRRSWRALARERDLAIVIMHHVTLRGRKSDDPHGIPKAKVDRYGNKLATAPVEPRAKPQCTR
jgi:hypothetical protein